MMPWVPGCARRSARHPARWWTYDYMSDFVYKDKRLEYIHTPDGRMQPRVNEAGNTGFVYDFYTKDHLGNIRSTITAEPMSLEYLASHEIAAAYIENLFFDNIPPVRAPIPGGTGDEYAVRLNASDTARRTGTSIMLRVMPGDRFDISVESAQRGQHSQPGSSPRIRYAAVAADYPDGRQHLCRGAALRAAAEPAAGAERTEPAGIGQCPPELV
ncbi:MAG: hypothetical protein KL787_04210 [Taibaiella sp.]|nr:hypothetical protein [Taibaiella sp.]